MPTRPPTLSLAPGGGGRTPEQRAAVLFYKRAPWLKLRAAVLAESPLCADCPADRPTIATHVHHKQEVIQRPDLALDRENLESLCEACHTRRHKGTGRRF